jgi:hypothetical protein
MMHEALMTSRALTRERWLTKGMAALRSRSIMRTCLSAEHVAIWVLLDPGMNLMGGEV